MNSLVLMLCVSVCCVVCCVVCMYEEVLGRPGVAQEFPCASSAVVGGG